LRRLNLRCLSRTPPRSSPPSSCSRQLPPSSARCSFLWAAPAPAPAYDDYDARTTTGAFTASPTPSLLDPPWAWSTEASRRTWATRTRLDAAAAHCLPRMCFLLACARGARQATASSDGTAAGRRGVPLTLAPWHPPLAAEEVFRRYLTSLLHVRSPHYTNVY